MDPQLVEYRRQHMKRRAVQAAFDSRKVSDTAAATASVGSSWLEHRITLPGFNRSIPLWQLGLATLPVGMLWLNVVRPYLYAWLLIVGLAGLAAWVYTRMGDEGDSTTAELLQAVKGALERSYQVGELSVVGWHLACALLCLTLLLGPWVIGWAVLLALGACLWAQRARVSAVGEAALRHLREQGLGAREPAGQAGGARVPRGRGRRSGG
mmetsp:Transcript_100669/g.314687  ORF Transcript_100669/g.314687 Transcript_100669/m.314687 type:complete len:210 (-) Transcript_100669:29-658(-)